ncbi:hypothetical protein EJB05_41470, partial [Eragrostis curvula]
LSARLESKLEVSSDDLGSGTTIHGGTLHRNLDLKEHCEIAKEVIMKRKFEGMYMLTDLVHNVNHGVSGRTRSHFKSKTLFKDPKLGTCSRPISEDILDIDSDIDETENDLINGSSLSVEHSSDVLRTPDGTFTCGFWNISYNAAVFSTVWTNNVSSSDASQAQLLDTGNLVVKGKGLGIMRRLTLDYDGNLRLYSMDQNGTWMVTWMAYPELCYVRGLCGMNGICVYTPAPTCTCAPGYEAVDPRDGRQGCKPKFRIRCDERQNMKFVKISNSDFLGHDQDVRIFVSLSTCKNICMGSCSCMGFTYWQGAGNCYIKSAIVGGLTHPSYPGSVYIKLPEDVEVLESSIPHSQPFGSEFGSQCNAVSINVTVGFLDVINRSYNGAKYWMLEQNAKLHVSEQSWIAGIIDSRLNGQFNSLQASTMVKVAVSCIQEERSTRPNMENVVQMLLSVDEAGSTM